MKTNHKQLRIAALGFVAVLAIYGAIRSQFFSTSNEIDTFSQQPVAAPVLGKVTMIDLGATECIPCKMMAPIIEKLKKEYAGKAEIIFIDVWKDSTQARKYDIRTIPTQIFFDQNGREVLRHTGFIDKKRIVGILSRMGVP